MKKKIWSLTLVAAMAATMLAGCGGTSSGTDEKSSSQSSSKSSAESSSASSDASGDGSYTIGYTYYYSTEFITLMNKGIEAKAEELGVKIIALDAENDPSNQITQVENLIAQQVDCLYIAAVDGDAIVPAIDMAKEAGIPLVAVNMTFNTDEDYYYSGPDDVLAGEMEMQSAIDAIGGKGKVCILQGPVGSSAMNDRQQGNDNVLAENPDIECVAVQPANWSREEAETLVENWIQAFDGIDAIVAHNDEMALGAIMAIEGAGLTPGKDIIVTGIDAIADGCDAIKEGKLLSSVYQDAALEGSQGLQICYDVLTGNPPEKYMNLIDMTLYTKDNVQELIDELYS